MQKQPQILHQACIITLTDTTKIRIDHVYIHSSLANPFREQFWKYLGAKGHGMQIIIGISKKEQPYWGEETKPFILVFRN